MLQNRRRGCVRMKCFTVSLRGVWSWSLFWRRVRLRILTLLSGVKCNFVAVYFTSAQFILQQKFCLYAIVHLLLEEFKISLQSSLSAQSLCRTISPRVGIKVQVFLHSESGVLNFLTLESESYKNQQLRIPGLSVQLYGIHLKGVKTL